MFITARNMKNKIISIKQKAYDKGFQSHKNISDLEILKIRNDYEIKIIDLETDIRILEKTISDMEKNQKDGIDKNRQADKKVLKAQEIVLHVQKAIDNISDAAARSNNDMENLRETIEGQVKKIMER